MKTRIYGDPRLPSRPPRRGARCRHDRGRAQTRGGTSMTTAEVLRQRMDAGVLSFPLTAFTERGELDPGSFRTYLRMQLAADPAAVFVACGTGEFFSLTLDEYTEIVRITVEETAQRVPVIAGVGYGWAVASQYALRAAEAGADGALLMPHYLVKA